MMETTPNQAELPSFERPPLSEVVLSLQFGTLSKFRTVHAGLFWGRIRSEFPAVSEHPPLNPAFEKFGTPPTPGPTELRFEFAGITVPRYWFAGANDEDLIQLQRDRIIRNWRKRGATYPRYHAVRRAFRDDVDRFVRFLDEEGLGRLDCNQCEVTYVNSIELPDGSNPHVQLDRITPLVSSAIEEDWGAGVTQEAATLQQRRVIAVPGGPIGRLYVSFSPAYQGGDAVPIVQLEITARVKPSGSSVEDAFVFLDEGHQVVVRAFESITSPELHNFWGRQ